MTGRRNKNLKVKSLFCIAMTFGSCEFYTFSKQRLTLLLLIKALGLQSGFAAKCKEVRRKGF